MPDVSQTGFIIKNVFNGPASVKQKALLGGPILLLVMLVAIVWAISQIAPTFVAANALLIGVAEVAKWVGLILLVIVVLVASVLFYRGARANRAVMDDWLAREQRAQARRRGIALDPGPVRRALPARTVYVTSTLGDTEVQRIER